MVSNTEITRSRLQACSVDVLLVHLTGEGACQCCKVYISIVYLLVCFCSPVEKLSRERPLSNIFNFYVLLSVLLQFALHIGSMFTSLIWHMLWKSKQHHVNFPLC